MYRENVIAYVRYQQEFLSLSMFSFPGSFSIFFLIVERHKPLIQFWIFGHNKSTFSGRIPFL